MLSWNLRMMLSAAVFVYFILLVYFLKKKALEMKYTLLWIFAGIVMAACIFCPEILAVLTGFLGMQSYMNGLYTICIGFLIILLMSLTSIVSRHAAKLRTLIQENAMMEKRIRDLEVQLKKNGEKEDLRSGGTDEKE